MTNYVILKQTESGDWDQITAAVARTPRGAIAAALEGSEDAEGTYIALPARHWRPVAVAVDTKTVVTLT